MIQTRSKMRLAWRLSDASSPTNLRQRREREMRERGMGGEGRMRALVGLAVAMFLGIAVYLRIWTIDYSISSDDTDLLRRQFDLASREAMDESAEWRLKYDEQVEKVTECVNELQELKESFENKAGDAVSISQKVAMIQKENMALLERVETLKRELEDATLKCNLHKIH
ncbi:hypothetical protein F2P56_007620 [Juglans regia]|uniref:Uncharacterized protein LOC109009064 n=2 Tax=Juglans regia TaxID=51240 RepID=A0A2I4GM35_JUGRE|nr:uncharacterized protein LOC109009064 [Juglans regia]KAF5475858.1 hypothetical protein F2P56_007620 [Juglans regia]